MRFSDLGRGQVERGKDGALAVAKGSILELTLDHVLVIIIHSLWDEAESVRGLNVEPIRVSGKGALNFKRFTETEDIREGEGEGLLGIGVDNA